MSEGTLPVAVVGLPVRTLSVKVISGVDAGLSVCDATEAVTVGIAEGNALRLTDPSVSRFHVELSRRGDKVLVRDLGSTNGTLSHGLTLVDGAVPPGTVLQLGHTQLEVGSGKTKSVELSEADALGPLKGQSPVMRTLLARIDKAARTLSAALLTGESGTGKELIARALHERGPRAKKPFVTVDCGSLSPGLVASELFGHERGAFTGADRKHVGAFEQADGGTVFLDEIGELSPTLQASLLGVLERQRFRRVGGSEEISVDVRVVSATHRDLRAAVNAGSFRLDLFFRLAVVKLDVPALRARVEDLELLITHFLKEAGSEASVGDVFPKDVLSALRAHHWPGNVRELRNLVESTLAMGEPPALESPVPSETSLPGPERTYKDARAELLHRFEGQYLSKLMTVTKGNVSAAARHAKMDRSHLIELLQRHGLRNERE
ncbi:MAG: sigma 54-dependent Fis family transcriptional regulator [Archangium sp.]|nr:sigma 54-dependent Fis family transcriptional regulator [Archangium sp.]MDP3575493.1 sigma 54-dependent Fis family transcriptional regulator [Archangium sp.]